MMRRALAVLSILAMVQVSAVPPAQAAERAPLVILTVGDSITEGATMAGSVGPAYRAELGRLLDAAGQPHEFVVAGVGGTPCGYWAPRMRDLMITHQPDVVLIACGTNDRLDNKTAGQVAAWEGAYRALFDTVLDTNPRTLAWPALVQYSATRTPGCDVPGAGASWLPPSEAVANDAIYRAMLVIDEWGQRVPGFIDYQKIPPAYMDECGVHPTPAGYAIMGRLAYASLAAKLGLQPAPATCGLTGHRPGYREPADRLPCN